MNINEYKNAMADIKVDPIEVASAIQQKMKRAARPNFVKLIPVCALFIICTLLIPFIRGANVDAPDIVITAYAAENEEVQLTKDFIHYQLTASPYMMGSSIDKEGNYYDSSVNYNLFFHCEGENIKTITYTCSDKEISRDSLSSASVYYVENTTLSGEEYKNYSLSEDEKALSMFYDNDGLIGNLTRLVGNSYTVPYNEQNSKQYGFVAAATVDKNGNYQFQDIIINVNIQMMDGSEQKKQILIHPIDTTSEQPTFKELAIKVL